MVLTVTSTAEHINSFKGNIISYFTRGNLVLTRKRKQLINALLSALNLAQTAAKC